MLPDEVTIRIPLDGGAHSLFEDNALVQFFELMTTAVLLREAIRECYDAGIRGTDGAEEAVANARQQLTDLAAQLLTKRLELEFNRALAHLEAYFDRKTR